MVKDININTTSMTSGIVNWPVASYPVAARI
jgi:hypothetical protein